MYFRGISVILSLFYCILLISLLCRKFDITENYTLFRVNSVSLKFGWCQENYILNVCPQPTLPPPQPAPFLLTPIHHHLPQPTPAPHGSVHPPTKEQFIQGEDELHDSLEQAHWHYSSFSSHRE